MKRPKPGAAWISASLPAPIGAGCGSRLKVAGSGPEVSGAVVMAPGYRDTRTSKYRVFPSRRSSTGRAPDGGTRSALSHVGRYERRLHDAYPHPPSADVDRDLVVLAHPGGGVDQSEPDSLPQGGRCLLYTSDAADEEDSVDL